MAETWPSTPVRRLVLHTLDVIGRAVAFPIRRRIIGRDAPKRVLVIEPWNIGDVVLATPLLNALRDLYPTAQMTLLGKPHARILLEASGLVDDVITCDLPWTASQNKYPMRLQTLKQLSDLIEVLRARKFDLTLDARMDIRSNLLAALAGGHRRVGFSTGGGGWLLTDYLPADRRNTHKISDWLDLLTILPDGVGARNKARRVPMLVVSSAERTAALRALTDAGAAVSPIIAYHPGGSHPAKRWPLDHFEKLIGQMQRLVGGSHVVFLGPNDQKPSAVSENVIVRRPSLRQLMSEIACCDALVCNDSGPMHIADALGVPVVAIFEIGNPQWYGPSGPHATVIAGAQAGVGISAAPLQDPPANPVAVERVVAAMSATLGNCRIGDRIAIAATQ